MMLTAGVLGAAGVVKTALPEGSLDFVAGASSSVHRPSAHKTASAASLSASPAEQSGASALNIIGFGAAFGASLVAVRQQISSRTRRTARHAEESGAEIEVAEKAGEVAKLSYLENVPRAVLSKEYIDGILLTTPEDQWEDPPEDSLLYTLKVYAETYGEGKATKMPWWDWLYMRVELGQAMGYNSPGWTKDRLDDAIMEKRKLEGKQPLQIPILGAPYYTGMTLNWKPEKELFAGDQIRSPISDSRFAKNFMANTAFYREGLENWQRGLEIGMGHGYFLVGPFTALGPLRNTPEAATVGVLSAAAIIGIVSVGGLLFGATVKPRSFDKDGDAPGSGFQEIINWHAVGGLGGAGFAHLLITLFG
eukprot:CAMPEP_0178402792 /NCGR_PEP_ID=MMETSP0689_2-20121128/17030_1 /TAXON_ID=160604 /ORGANISM="Amphidinium massartii, Strain CS-259" /LENGTH=363 /DNA_ID=CAMNT_0020023715 /DNA_START=123 /DNA_END=1214 /DNA_ORIENTATION=+